MPRDYDSRDWYWLVDARPGEVYHSARFAYVSDADADFVAFLADENFPTAIATENELRDVLAAAGVAYLAEPLPPLIEERPRIVRARARLVAASFTVPAGSPVAVPWSAAQVDPLGMHQAPGNPERLVIPEAGWYRFVVGVRWAESGGGAGVGYRALALMRGLGGSPTDLGTMRLAPSPALDTSFGFTEFAQLAAGDVLRAFVQHGAPSPLDAVARVTLVREE